MIFMFPTIKMTMFQGGGRRNRGSLEEDIAEGLELVRWAEARPSEMDASHGS